MKVKTAGVDLVKAVRFMGWMAGARWCSGRSSSELRFSCSSPTWSPA